MIQDRHYIVQCISLLADALCALLAVSAAYLSRTALAHVYAAFAGALPGWFPPIVPYEEMHLFQEYIWLFPVCAILWPAALNRWGYYDFSDLHGTAARRGSIIKASLFCTLVLVTLVYVFKAQFIARIVVVGTGVWACAFILLKDAMLRAIIRRRHMQPAYQYHVLLVTQNEKKEKAMRVIHSFEEWGVRMHRVCDYDATPLDAFPDVLTDEPVDEVVFAVTPQAYAEVPPYVAVCEKLGIRTRILVDVYSPQICALKAEMLATTPALVLYPTTLNVGARTLKLFADKILAALLLCIFSPLLLLIAACIAITSRGGVFYCQTRCGLNARPFTLYKFRSMRHDADAMLPQLKEKSDLHGWAFKMKNDPRITRPGKILRRYSLDELPQLWNVLRGEMSLVGPRPVLPHEVTQFQLWERRRFSMKPGITGLWQVKGRTEIPNEKWVAYDLEYIDNWSLWRDCRILFQTIRVVLRGQGQ